MRRVLIGDLLAAASVISRCVDHTAASQTLICQADAAHRYTKRYGRPHPNWGNGSLMARAMAISHCGFVGLTDRQMLDAMAQLCMALSARRKRTEKP